MLPKICFFGSILTYFDNKIIYFLNCITALVDGCYEPIFSGCTSKDSIKIGYTGNYDSAYFKDWVKNRVATYVIFYYNGAKLHKILNCLAVEQ